MPPPPKKTCTVDKSSVINPPPLSDDENTPNLDHEEASAAAAASLCDTVDEFLRLGEQSLIPDQKVDDKFSRWNIIFVHTNAFLSEIKLGKDRRVHGLR